MVDENFDDARLQRVTEALIFASDEPITAATIADIYAEGTGDDRVDTDHVERAVEALNAKYEDQQLTFRIETWAGGFRLATTPEVAPFVRALLEAEQERRLSRSLIETLAVVAYKQPVTKPEVDFVRGVNADYALRKLLETRLVEVVGRDDSVGRPLLYGTTDYFLDQFGIGGLDDLPRPREIEELLEDPGFTRERAELLSAMDTDTPPVHSDEAPDGEAQA